VLLLLLLLYLSRIPTSPKCFSVGSCIINFNFNTYILQNNSHANLH
jgi:hypothetical protein